MEKELAVSGAEEKGMMELFGTQVIQKASDYAQELKKIIDKQELFTIIGTNKHVHVEGWTTLGALLRVFPDVVSTERIEVGGTIRGYLVEITRYDKYTKKDIVSEGRMLERFRRLNISRGLNWLLLKASGSGGLLRSAQIWKRGSCFRMRAI